MQKKISLRLLPSEAGNDKLIKKQIALATGNKINTVSGYHIIKHSIDARARNIWVNLIVNAFIGEPFQKRTIRNFDFIEVKKALKKVIIIGAGPAGLFAALQLIEKGIKPVIIERGKEVRARRRDLARLNKEGIINPESNYCFGEGGAGTYSDGKLYTRSTKRGDIERILNLFVQFGADENILYETHPHIGTNKLPQIITSIRERIIDCGGEFLFECKVVDLIIKNEKVGQVKTADGQLLEADAYILATGHSARDIFELLHNRKILIESKPFALGVRVEHPQSLIDQLQYNCILKDGHLPPAAYSLVHQANNRGVFSFCMCPGGIIAPAASSNGEVVVNGWSPSKRNNPYANSGIVVQVEKIDAFNYLKKSGDHPVYNEDDPLLMMRFQEKVEQDCFNAGGEKFVAPAQRMTDFSNEKISTSLPRCSYVPGLQSFPLNEVLPGFIYKSLAGAFIEFGKKMHGNKGTNGYFTNEAVVVATESRTSSPVRIPRDPISLTHQQIRNLYPCGEGAGYAGGIVSAAMDGERVAMLLADLLIGRF